MKNKLMVDPEELGDVISEVPDEVKGHIIDRMIQELKKERFRTLINERIAEANGRDRDQERHSEQVDKLGQAIVALIQEKYKYVECEGDLTIVVTEIDLTLSESLDELESQIQIQKNTLFKEKQAKWIAVVMEDKRREDRAVKNAENVMKNLSAMEYLRQEIEAELNVPQEASRDEEPIT